MDFDNHVNLLIGTVQIAPSPSTTGDTLTLMPGDGSGFKANMPVTVYPDTVDLPTRFNAEIAYVTEASGDVLKLQRATEDSLRLQIKPGWKVVASATAKTFTDIEEAIASTASDLVIHTLRTDNPHAVNKGQIGLGSVENYSASQLRDRSTHHGTQPISSVDNLEEELAGKATTADVDSAVADLVDLAPGALDTLNELAAAMGDDPNFAGTVTTQLGNKVDRVAGKDLSTNDYTDAEKAKLSGIAAGATQNAPDASLRDRTTHTGSQPISSVTGLQTALDGKIAKLSGADRIYINNYAGEPDAGYFSTNPDPFTFAFRDGNGRLSVASPNTDSQAANRLYVDTATASKASLSHTHTQSDVTGLSTALSAKVQIGGDLGGTITAPTVKGRLRIFDVRDYGAIADGTTNDATAVKAALDAAQTAGGGIVQLMPGTHAIASSMTGAYRNILVRGYPNSTLKATASFTNGMINCDAGSSSTSRMTFESIIFDTNSQTNVQGVSIKGGTYSAGAFADQFMFRECTFKNLATTDLGLVTVYSGRGSTDRGPVTRVHFDRCEFQDTVKYHVYFNGGEIGSVRFWRCMFRNSQYGAVGMFQPNKKNQALAAGTRSNYDWMFYDCKFVNNHLSSTALFAFIGDFTDSNRSGVRGLRFVDCQFEGNGDANTTIEQYALSIHSSWDVHIVGCSFIKIRTFLNVGQSYNGPWYQEDGTQFLTVRDNYFYKLYNIVDHDSAFFATWENNKFREIWYGGIGGYSRHFPSRYVGNYFYNTPADPAAAGIRAAAFYVDGRDGLEIHNNIAVDDRLLPNPTTAPTLSQVAGGSLPARDYFVTYTFRNDLGQTLASAEATISISANNLLKFDFPYTATYGPPQGAKWVDIYVATSSGAGTLQTSQPVAWQQETETVLSQNFGPVTWTELTSGLVAGSSKPSSNTTKTICKYLIYEADDEVGGPHYLNRYRGNRAYGMQMLRRNATYGSDAKDNFSVPDLVTGEVVETDPATKASVGLANVDNTPDLDKPVSTATLAALDTKVSAVPGKGLSTNDYTTADRDKLAAITGVNTGDQDLSGYVLLAGGQTITGPMSLSNTLDLGGNVSVADGRNFSAGTGTGTKLGTSTTQKFGFFNATPVAQQSATTDIGTVLANLGLRASGTAWPITTSGTITSNGILTTTARRSPVTVRTATVTLSGTTVEDNPCDATAGSFTVNLPANSTGLNGQRFWFIKTDSTANTVTIKAAGSELINGANTYVLSTQWKSALIIATGSGWLVRTNN